jgi:diaminopimelate decarboxylase/aspartate kinase
MAETPISFVVLKFGGTSVTGADRWRTIGAQARARLEEGLTPVLVCSALSGVTNQLEALIAAAAAGRAEGREKGQGGGFEEVMKQLRDKHGKFAAEMGVDPEVIKPLLDDLERLALGASLVGEVSPRVQARILSAGELLSTKLGAAWLASEGMNAVWQDARECLTTTANGTSASSFLSAECSDAHDAALTEKFTALGADAIVTQGFIASRPDGQTAVLGRGGSDTSAAYFAARLQAKRCEIWTDVPGVYTANPREVPTARLLRSLDYDEAQEIATCGAKVLHPRCLLPARRRDIPIIIRCTPLPDMDGTHIGRTERTGGARVKAISAKRGVTLVSMDTLGMWQQVGFLSDIFGVFRDHGVSVDLVSTSESNVTASIDESQAMEPDALERLQAELGKICKTTLIRACAAVSMVGRDIRTILHRLGPALELFEEHRIHLVSQAASDLNLTFVVDEEQAERLVRQLHALFFHSEGAHDPLLGPSYADTFGASSSDVDADEPSAPVTPWWVTRRDDLLAIAEQGTPRYVYDRATVQARAEALLGLKAVDRVFYAMKANPHPGVLSTLYAAGVGFECVSVGELNHVAEHIDGLDVSRVLFTPNFASPTEYATAFERGVRVNVDNLEVLEQAPDVFKGQDIMLPPRACAHRRSPVEVWYRARRARSRRRACTQGRRPGRGSSQPRGQRHSHLRYVAADGPLPPRGPRSLPRCESARSRRWPRRGRASRPSPPRPRGRRRAAARGEERPSRSRAVARAGPLPRR